MPSTLSTEYVRVRVTAKKLDVAVDPTADTVQIGFTQGGSAPTWNAATWEPYAHSKAVARTQLTAGQLAAGSWDVFVKITDSPEIPVIYAGSIVMTAP